MNEINVCVFQVDSERAPMVSYINGYLVKEEDLFEDMEQVMKLAKIRTNRGTTEGRHPLFLTTLTPLCPILI